MTDSFNNVAKHLPEATIPTMVGIGAIALEMAMRWHDMTIVKDGGMYQQLKLDNKPIKGIDLSDVFETAKKIEQHLMNTNDRIAGMVVDVLETALISQRSVQGMIDDFINQEIPEHPEPCLYVKTYNEINSSHDQVFLVSDSLIDETLKRCLGLEGDFELDEFDDVISSMSPEKRDLLSAKASFCFEYEECHALIEKVINKDPTLPSGTIKYDPMDEGPNWRMDNEWSDFLIMGFTAILGKSDSFSETFKKALNCYSKDQYMKFRARMEELYIVEKPL